MKYFKFYYPHTLLLVTFLGLILINIGCVSNTKDNSNAAVVLDSVALIDSLVQSAAATASNEAGIDSSTYEFEPPKNFSLLRSFVLDWHDGEVVVPDGKFWVIATMLSKIKIY